MSQQPEYFDPHHYPDERGAYGEVRNPHPEEWEGPPRGHLAEGPRPPPARTGLRRAGVWLGIVVAALVVLGGGAFLASRLGWIDLAGLSSGGGSPAQTGGDVEVVFSGNAKALTAAPGNIVQEDTSVSPPAVWVRSRVKSASAAGSTGGVSVEVPASLVPRIEGRRIRVTITARTGGKDAVSPFAVAYSAGDKGTSGWIVFTPTKTLDDYSFVFPVPIGEIDANHPHYIGIWSDISGGNAPLLIQRITVEPL